MDSQLDGQGEQGIDKGRQQQWQSALATSQHHDLSENLNNEQHKKKRHNKQMHDSTSLPAGVELGALDSSVNAEERYAVSLCGCSPQEFDGSTCSPPPLTERLNQAQFGARKSGAMPASASCKGFRIGGSTSSCKYATIHVACGMPVTSRRRGCWSKCCTPKLKPVRRRRGGGRGLDFHVCQSCSRMSKGQDMPHGRVHISTSP